MGAKAELHLDILPPEQFELFELISRVGWISSFYLAGGTALALQIGHRRSIDFDFFTDIAFDPFLLKKRLEELGEYELFSESKDTVNAALNSIKISFFGLPYALIGKEIKYNNLRLASKEDISAMKLAAVSSRGSRKDFVDMYFLLKELSLEEIVGNYEQKYGKNEENVYCALKGLAYFSDAEEEPMPKMISKIGWNEIKKEIISEHKKYINKIRLIH